MHLWPHQFVLAPRCPVVHLSQASLWSCLGKVEVSFWLCRTLAVIPVWVSHALCIPWLQVLFHHPPHLCLLGVVCLSQVAKFFCRLAQLRVVVAYTCFRSTQYHMLVIPEAAVDESLRPHDGWLSHFTEVYQAQSRLMMISRFYQHRYQHAFLFHFTVKDSHVTDVLNTFSHI